MKLIKIQSSKDPLIAQVPELYESAFSEAVISSYLIF